jgi:UDP-glucose 6-dehydrogenase
MMRIGVIGNGVVGHATARCWMEHAEVKMYDVLKERSTHVKGEVVGGTDLVFVCLPEASIEEFFQSVLPWRFQNYVLKSTVPIGTTRRLAEKYGLENIVHSPEFLTARRAVTDAQTPARNIIGYPNFVPLEESTSQHLIWDLYLTRFPGVQCLRMLSDESEATKLFTNAFFAVKVSIFNEFRSLADKLNLNWDTVLSGILSDGRIAHSHTQVPGPDGKRGFGGACLVKDAEMLVEHLLENGFPEDCGGWTRGEKTRALLTATALFRNDEIDRKEGV